MKMFLLGMLVMYLGTTIITTVVSACGLDEEEFLEIVFSFPLVVIGVIIRPIWNFIKFPRVCVFCLSRGINPWHFKYSQVVELSEKNQQKFIKAHPKKYQKKVEEILDDFRN